MERDCKKCIHHISGACDAWECHMETLQDYRAKAIDEFAEKVVAELEKEKEIHTNHYNISIYKDFPEIKQRYKQICGVIDKVIDIVKRGGVE